MSTVSVIIPTYNLEAYLERAILSALNQTHKPVEILVIDNNSTDNTLKIANNYAALHENLVQVIQESRQGAPYARNRGLFVAKGEWIQFLDGDDVILPQKIAYQLKYVAKSAGFVVSAAIDKALDGTETTIPLAEEVWKGLFIGGGHMGYTSSILWNTKALKAIGGWDVTLSHSQEYDLMFRLLQSGYQAVLAPNAYTFRYQRGAGQISHAPYADFLISSFPLKSQILYHILQQPDPQRKNITLFFKHYYNLYTRLKVRRPDSAEQIKDQYFTPLITPQIKRQYPIIYWYQAKSGLYIFYKQVKTKIGKRGLLGKILGRAQHFFTSVFV